MANPKDVAGTTNDRVEPWLMLRHLNTAAASDRLWTWCPETNEFVIYRRSDFVAYEDGILVTLTDDYSDDYLVIDRSQFDEFTDTVVVDQRSLNEFAEANGLDVVLC